MEQSVNIQCAGSRAKQTEMWRRIQRGVRRQACDKMEVVALVEFQQNGGCVQVRNIRTSRQHGMLRGRVLTDTLERHPLLIRPGGLQGTKL